MARDHRRKFTLEGYESRPPESVTAQYSHLGASADYNLQTRGRGFRSRPQISQENTGARANTTRAPLRTGKTHPKQRGGKPAMERERWNIQAMPMGELKFLCRIRNSSELVDQLFDKLKSFQRTLQLSNKLEDRGIMDAIIYVLMRVSECLKRNGIMSEQSEKSKSRACQILGEVVSTRCPEFQLRLSIYIKRDLVDASTVREISERKHPPMIPHAYCTPHAKASSVCTLFRSLLEIIPESSWSVLPVNDLVSIIQNSPDLHDLLHEAETILFLYENIRSQNQSYNAYKRKAVKVVAEWDNSEYREEEILPEWEEVCIPQPPNRLRPNIVSGGYIDWMHYYDVQFRLLREDFVAPLRQGICEYIQGARGRKLQNVKVYKNVSLCDPLFARDGVCYDVHFDVSRLQKCRWEHSKRLLFGSLLCLSPDDFEKTIFFATVANREPEELKKGKLQIRFEGKGKKMLAFCGGPRMFTMAESMAYFEASRHILHSLQTAEVATMPFTQYLVQSQCEPVSMPKYLDKEAVVEYNLSCLRSKEEPPVIAQNTISFLFQEALGFHKSLNMVDIKSNIQWPSPDEVELDESQLKAIHMALTQEIAVIQGPPGTGKTYVGLKIVEALLKNRNVWDPKKESPIVVMCFTNHALDQFLEGIVQQSDVPKIVRIGGRCRNDRIQEFNIDKIRRRVHVPGEVFSHMKDCDFAVSMSSDEILHLHLRKYFHAKRAFLPLEELNSDGNTVSLKHNYQLFERAESTEENKLALELWLGIFTIYEEQSPTAPPRKEFSDSTNNLEVNGAGVQDTNTANAEETIASAEPSNEEVVEVVNESEEEGKEDLIDIEGVATIEQGARVSNESKFQAKRFQYSQVEDNYFKVVEQTIITTESKDSDTVGTFDHQNEARSEDEEMLLDWNSDHSSDEYTGNFDRITRSDYEIEGEDTQAETQETTQVQPYIKVRHITPQYADIHHFVAWGRQQPPMTAEEANRVDNIHGLSPMDRWRLYNYWVSVHIEQLSEDVEQKFSEYDRLCKERLEARRQADRFALETAEVIGMTTTGAAKYQHILHLVKPRIVIVEEAAEVLESHIVSALNAGTQHLILIGDHKQLRPKPNDFKLAREYKLEVSLFERLVINNFPHATLQIQHRMRPEIAQLVKPHIYHTLINHQSVHEYDSVVGVEKNLYFIQHEFPEAEDENLISHSNQHEAQFLAALCKYLLQQGYKPSQITILVTYAGQLLKMRAYMPKRIFEGVRVCTVDNFQGEENDIILLSLVRSSEGGKIGFLEKENRVCVSLSRAKMGFYCIGNIKLLRQKAPIWDTIMSDMDQKGYLGDALPLGCANHPSTKFLAKLPEDFAKNAPDGGCVQECVYRLPCGHVCMLKCHVFDPQHQDYECKKPCTKSCPEGHPCPLKCHQECKPCRTIVRKRMPSCGHTQSMKCHQDPRDVSCISDCEKKCDNGHPCPKRCSENCGVCQKVVVKEIPICGHKVSLPCYIPPLHKECDKPCEKLLPLCGHPCKRLCGQVCSPSSCTFQVEKALKCGHKIKVPCNKSNKEFACDKQCEKRLEPCGHPCKEKCSEPCTTKCMYQVNKTWPCGHKLKRRCYQTQDPLQYPCEKKCERKLPCGHTCSRKCGEDCSKFTCAVIIDKDLPCGHTQKIPCSSTDDPPCKMRCTYILPCGHRCEGKCSKCTSMKVHSPCKYGVEVTQYCGHRSVIPCLDMSDSHSGIRKQKQCTAYCPHKKCSDSQTHDCTTPCTPCTEPCAWSCPHHQCNKLCHEVCERPQCNERCENRLKCGHRCYGLCGEPCLTFCPECKRKDFNKHFNKALNKSPNGFDSTKLYVQLGCTHVFMVEFMDSYARHHEETRLVAPLQCPDSKCEHPALCSSYRYGNVVKKSLKDVNTVRTEVIEIKEHHAVLPDEIQDIRKRLQTIIVQYMQKKISPQTTSKKLYSDLVKAGWYTSRKWDIRVKSYHWYRYKPLSQKTEDMMKLQSQIDRTKTYQELYFLRLLITALELQTIAFAEDLKRISLSEITYTRDVKTQLVAFLNLLFSVRKQFQSRLSAQLVSDFQSEMYRITLIVQYCLVKKFATSALPSVIEAVHFLRQCAQTNSFQVRQQEFHKFSSLLARQYQTVTISACCNKVHHIVTPPVLKGTWWKCPNGHYYCVPLTMSGGEEASCPKC